MTWLTVKELEMFCFVITIQPFSHSWFIIGYVTKVTGLVPQLEQELLTHLKHISSPPFVGGGVAQCLVLCVVLGRSLFVLGAIVLTILPFTATDHPFGIYKPISYLQISSL